MPTDTYRTHPKSFDRRTAIKGLAASLGALSWPTRVEAQDEREPHFFLLLQVTGGLDFTYLFDARPLVLTEAGLQHTYLDEEPTVWEGANGVRTLAASPTNVLRPFAQDLAVANGVLMSTRFDGHDSNWKFLLTGNPFGNASFLASLNQSAPLDYVTVGRALVQDSRAISMYANQAFDLSERIHDMLPPGGRLQDFIESRYQRASQGEGRFSGGSASLWSAARQSPGLHSRLRAVDLNPAPAPEELYPPPDIPNTLAFLSEYFRQGIITSGIIDLTGNYRFDTHNAQAAAQQPMMYPALMAEVAEVLGLMKDTPFDDRRSLLDVTTVMFASEFGRTMRQAHLPLNATGTDHNPLANSILLAGKGIRGGVVIGQTDLQSAEEELSLAHTSLDRRSLQLMGRPFDFETGQSSNDAPQAYDPAHYLTFPSVVNTLFELFGVPRSAWFPLSGGGTPAPIVPSFLA